MGWWTYNIISALLVAVAVPINETRFWTWDIRFLGEIWEAGNIVVPRDGRNPSEHAGWKARLSHPMEILGGGIRTVEGGRVVE